MSNTSEPTFSLGVGNKKDQLPDEEYSFVWNIANAPHAVVIGGAASERADVLNRVARQCAESDDNMTIILEGIPSDNFTLNARNTIHLPYSGPEAVVSHLAEILDVIAHRESVPTKTYPNAGGRFIILMLSEFLNLNIPSDMDATEQDKLRKEYLDTVTHLLRVGRSRGIHIIATTENIGSDFEFDELRSGQFQLVADLNE